MAFLVLKLRKKKAAQPIPLTKLMLGGIQWTEEELIGFREIEITSMDCKYKTMLDPITNKIREVKR